MHYQRIEARIEPGGIRVALHTAHGVATDFVYQLGPALDVGRAIERLYGDCPGGVKLVETFFHESNP